MTRWKVLLAFVAAALVVLAVPAASYEGPSRLARATADTTPPTIQQPPDLTVAGTVPGSFQGSARVSVYLTGSSGGVVTIAA